MYEWVPIYSCMIFAWEGYSEIEFENHSQWYSGHCSKYYLEKQNHVAICLSPNVKNDSRWDQ